jgi:hypothetical protein
MRYEVRGGRRSRLLGHRLFMVNPEKDKTSRWEGVNSTKQIFRTYGEVRTLLKTRYPVVLMVFYE